MIHLKKFAFILCLLVGACAQVPKESVELSATVGRDLAEMKKSHLALVDIYYKDVVEDINMFVDKVYMPYQVKNTLSDPLFKNELLLAIEQASSTDPTGALQKDSIQKIEAFLLIIQEEVKTYRDLKLDPIKKQYAEVYDNISKSYEQIHYANSIVTGHLASVVKVHESQNEILEKLDLSDLRTDVGKGLSGLSNEIEKLVLKASKGEEKLDSIVSEFDAFLDQK